MLAQCPWKEFKAENGKVSFMLFDDFKHFL